MVCVKHAFKCVSKIFDRALTVESSFISNVLKYLNIIEIPQVRSGSAINVHNRYFITETLLFI